MNKVIFGCADVNKYPNLAGKDSKLFVVLSNVAYFGPNTEWKCCIVCYLCFFEESNR